MLPVLEVEPSGFILKARPSSRKPAKRPLAEYKRRDDGLVYLALRALARVVPRRFLAVHRFTLIKAEIPRNAAANARTVEVRWGSAADIRRFPLSDHVTNRNATEALAPGHEICVASADGGVVGYKAYARNAGERDGHEGIAFTQDDFAWLRLVLRERELWCDMAYVAPRYRGRGIDGDLRRFAFAHYRSTGMERCFAAIHAGNRPAFRSHKASGYQAFGTLVTLRLPGLTVVRAGRSYCVGRWTRERPLTLPIELFAD